MGPQPVQSTRIQRLNAGRLKKGRYVLYWMQQSQRAQYNHALEYAVQQANALGQGVVAGFGLTDDYPEANLRHYTFLLEGLRETRGSLAEQGIRLLIRRGAPPDVALALGREASMIVCDRGYLRHQKAWRARVARSADCPVVQVESDAVVPVAVVSDKAEYAARTLRPKLFKHLQTYLVPFCASRVKKPSPQIETDSLELTDIDAVVQKLRLKGSVGPVTRFFTGGASKGRAGFDEFLRERFHRYAAGRNQPQADDISRMSPYLHFGQLSPLELALKVKAAGGALEAAGEAYLEELIVRRELAINFVNYTHSYDVWGCLPGWARQTLIQHRADRRVSIYTRRRLEAAATHDPYWNAAMGEMKTTGFMHNTMRMYWGKKILEWSETPEDAFQCMLALNNKYFLDGRDPNSYAGVAWIFGLHDRPWPERPVFGKVRYMAASGLERKYDIRGYVRKVDSLRAGQDLNPREQP